MATTETALPQHPMDAHVFWYKNRGVILGLLLLSILCVVAFGLYKLYTVKRADSGAQALGAAKTETEYQAVIKDFADTPAGASARLFLAQMQHNKRQFAQAKSTLEEFLKKHPRHEMAGAAQVGVASNLEAMGKTDEALALLQKAASDNPKSYIAPLALISEVPLLRVKGREAEARRICETIITQYRESMWSNQAALELRSLKPAEGSAASGPNKPPPARGGQPPPMLQAPPAAEPGAPPAAGATAPPAPKATETAKKKKK